jgi:membrane protein involved in colicin uptake
MDRVEALIQNFIQTATTTTIKMTTSWIPGVSFLGALVTTAINWTVLCVKSASRGYDFYKIYSEMQEVIEEQGGKKMDLSARVGNLQKEAIAKVANTTVIPQIENQMKAAKANIQNNAEDAAKKTLEDISRKTTSQLQAKADEMKNKVTEAATKKLEDISRKTTSQLQAKADEMKNKATEAAMKKMTPESVAKLASVGNNLAQ